MVKGPARFWRTLAVAGALLAGAAQAQPSGVLPLRAIGQRYAYNVRGGPAQGGPGATVAYASASEEYAALKARAKGGSRLKAAELPDWSGVWLPWPAWGAFNFDPSLMRDADQYGPLSPDAQADYQKTLKNAEAGVRGDPPGSCQAAGFPRIMAEGFLHEFAVTPDVTWLIAEAQTEVRRVYTDGRGHLPDEEAYPMWEGDSIGFWDGKGDKARLVVWTRSVRAGVYHRNGPRYSSRLEAVEQIWKDKPDLIRVEMTVYDPVDLTRPWHVSRGFNRDRTPPQRILDQWVCAENDSVHPSLNGDTGMKLPGEPGYVDPGKLAVPPGK